MTTYNVNGNKIQIIDYNNNKHNTHKLTINIINNKTM